MASHRRHLQLLSSRSNGNRSDRNGSEISRSTNGRRRQRSEAFVISPVFADNQIINRFAGNQLRESLRKWQSPPDPSVNHNIADDRQHEGPAEWFIESDKYKKWKVAGSLLWIHGKRMFVLLVISVISSTVRFAAGSGKSILWFVAPQVLQYWETHGCRVAPQSSTMSQPSVTPDRLLWHTFILTFEISTSKPAGTSFLLSLSNCLIGPMPFATYSSVSTKHTTMAHVSLASRL